MKRKEWPTLFKFSSSGATQRWDIRAILDVGGEAAVEVSYGQDGGSIQSTMTRVLGKNIGKKNETTPFEQACLEAESKWKKQKDKGYTEGKPTEVVLTSPMLAHSYDENKSRVTYPCYWQPKLDGIRAIASMVGGKVTLWSRKGKELDKVPHINKVLETIMVEGDILDGELYCHGTPFQTIISWVKKNRPETARITYNVYDVITQDKFSNRFKTFCAIIGRKGQGIVKTVHTGVLNSEAEIEPTHLKAIERGYEGIMLRVGDCKYTSGQRSRELLKVKMFKDDEFEIVGAEEGQGKAEGQATLICKTAAGAEFKARCRGEDSVREEQWKNRAKYVGQKLTVRYQDYTTGDNPVPRFPVGIAVRDYED